MQPADVDQFRTELTGCIALCMPAGFTAEARQEWLRAAWGTLNGIPADLLRIGCADARKQADHPSKIVPAIMRSIGMLWEARKAERAAETGAPRLVAPPDKPAYVTPAEAAAILEEFGLRSEPCAPVSVNRGPPRVPTAAEMAEIAASLGPYRQMPAELRKPEPAPTWKPPIGDDEEWLREQEQLERYLA